LAASTDSSAHNELFSQLIYFFKNHVFPSRQPNCKFLEDKGILFIHSLLYYKFFIERDREEGQKERENLKQAPHPAQSPMRGSISRS